MRWLTVDYIKRHSRIDYDCEDEELELYGNSAEETILNLLHRSYESLLFEYGQIPQSIVHATLELVDSSYQHRSPSEPTNLYMVPYGFDLKLKPYMILI